MEFPSEVSAFLSAVRAHLPKFDFVAEPGGEKLGNWWIDVRGSRAVTIEWRPGRGFGLSTDADTGYGEGPSEIFRQPSRAAQRAAQLLAPGSHVRANRLGALRELYGITQRQMASRLKQQQAAISRLESRDDTRLETLSRYVRAMGGHLEVRAIFADAQMPIFDPGYHHRKPLSRTKIKSLHAASHPGRPLPRTQLVSKTKRVSATKT